MDFIDLDFSDQIKARLLNEIGSEEEISEEIWAAEEKKGKTLNKPFRTSGGPKKFSVYVKNDKGNVVKVNFGDPNMEIKRDDPARRKSFRARHNCENPGPKTKARYWSCKQWRSSTKVQGSEEEIENEMLILLDESEAKKGLWENIRDKKKREGKDYRPAKPGEKDYPDPKALKKAQESSKKKKSKAAHEDEKSKDNKDGKKDEKKESSKDSGLTEKQKKLPDFIKKNLLKNKK